MEEEITITEYTENGVVRTVSMNGTEDVDDMTIY